MTARPTIRVPWSRSGWRGHPVGCNTFTKAITVRAHAYNRAFEAAQAPIVLLIADDIFLSPQALKEHVEMHRRHPEEEVAMFGRTEISPEL